MPLPLHLTFIVLIYTSVLFPRCCSHAVLVRYTTTLAFPNLLFDIVIEPHCDPTGGGDDDLVLILYCVRCYSIYIT